MRSSIRWSVVIGSGILAGLILLVGTVFLLIRAGWLGGTPRNPLGLLIGRFESNGERIYFTGTSASGEPITAQMPGMHRVPPGMMACVACHGENGQGGTVGMMMGSFVAPDIRYKTLTGQDHGKGHEDHNPYTEETIKRAITDGIDPDGKPLEWPMLRWSMSESDLNDLLAYLKSLD